MDEFILNYIKTNGNTRTDIVYKKIQSKFKFPKVTQIYHANGGLSEDQEQSNISFFYKILNIMENKNLIRLKITSPPFMSIVITEIQLV